MCPKVWGEQEEVIEYVDYYVRLSLILAKELDNTIGEARYGIEAHWAPGTCCGVGVGGGVDVGVDVGQLHFERARTDNDWYFVGT